ncbi:hypothetical protein CLOP_g20263 [Closterium sp. NIES-67]|nr:hypothetical protein CLOP_g20263 [Closterium sp. NIES-67]
MTMAGPLLLRRAALAVLVLFSLLSVLLAEGDSSASSNAGTGSASAHPVYLVHLRAAAVASYRGGVEGLPATAAAQADPDTTGAGGAGSGSGASSLSQPGHSRQSSFGSGGSHGPSRVRLPRVDMQSAAVKSYMGYLAFLQARVMEDAAVDPSSVLHSYKVVSSGFAAALSPSQLQQLQQHPAVVAVHRSSTIHMLSTRPSTSFDWLDSVDSGNLAGSANQTRHRRGLKGLQGRRGLLHVQRQQQAQQQALQQQQQQEGAQVQGDGMVVGVVDSGIWPEHPSFSDKLISPPLSAPPSSWKGRCEPTKDFPASACNRKLIGARVFYQGFQEEVGTKDWDLKGDWLSPRDSTGTGTWLAGAAAGSANVPTAPVFGSSIGRLSGVAPRAHLAVYKVSWKSKTLGGNVASTVDVAAAVEAATADGVHVLLVAVKWDPATTYFESLHYFNAHLARVTVVFTAGDYGPPSTDAPEYRNVAHYNPFGLTVGASTTSQRYFTTVTLGNGTVLQGRGMGGGTIKPKLPVVAGAAAPGNVAAAPYCKPGSLNKGVKGKVVVCIGGRVLLVDMVQEVLAKKGAGVILLRDNLVAYDTLIPYDARLPVVLLLGSERSTLQEYIGGTASPKVTIAQRATSGAGEAPAMLLISSTGPVTDPSLTPEPAAPTNDILKPDLIAPGVCLFGAAPGTVAKAKMKSAAVAMASGTGVAASLTAGIAALVMQSNPAWTPAEVMSAMQTTADAVSNKGGPIKDAYGADATPWAMGQGHVSAAKVVDPGLVYPASSDDFYNFLAGQDATKAAEVKPAHLTLAPIHAFNLNRASISVSRLQGSVIVKRRVTNMGGVKATYTAAVVAPSGVDVTVQPSTFDIEPAGAVSFTVTLTPMAVSEEFVFGSLTWEDGKGHSVRSVIAVQPLALPA